MKRLSIVAPAYNEAGGLPLLVERLRTVLGPLGERYELELWIVDDGSSDRTPEVLAELAAREPRLRYLRLARNFGHQAALTAGLEAARGDAVVSLDADLQHPPEMIPDMVALWEQGYDVVETRKLSTVDSGWLRQQVSFQFYKVMARWAGFPVSSGADFRLLDRQAVSALGSLPERHRLYRGLVPWLGFRRCTIDYTAQARSAGESKYSLRKLAALAADGLFSFTNVPLRLALFAGGLTIACAAAYAIWVAWEVLVMKRAVPQGWTSLLLTTIVSSGVNLIVLGILGEYIGRIYDQVKGRPLYVLDERRSLVGDRARPHEPQPREEPREPVAAAAPGQRAPAVPPAGGPRADA